MPYTPDIGLPVVELVALVREVVVVEVAVPVAADRVVIVGFTGNRLGEVFLTSLRVVGPSLCAVSLLLVAGLRNERMRLKPVVEDITIAFIPVSLCELFYVPVEIRGLCRF